jgi:hypothetical protein
MPLLDHFHPPLLLQRHWEGFHGWWVAAIVGELNEHLLPAEYFAEFEVTLGTRVSEASMQEQPQRNGGATAVQTLTWAPPTPAAVIPAVFPDDFQVKVFHDAPGPTLVAAIELISPRNKDRPEARRAFAAKCTAYLQRGIGLIVVDVVTSRHANLHDELATLLGPVEVLQFPNPVALYATAYRPAHRQEKNEIDVWREPLALGQSLPTAPLAVRGLGSLPINLEATYMEARKRGRIG